MEETIKAVRREVAGLDRRTRTEPYPAGLRERVVELAEEWVSTGRRHGELCRRIGIHRDTVRRWLEQTNGDQTGGELVPVRVVKSGGSISKRVTEAGLKKSERFSSPIVVSPTGWRVQGLTVGQVVELLRAVG